MVADKAPKGGLMTLVSLRFPRLKFLVICMNTVMPTKRQLGRRGVAGPPRTTPPSAGSARRCGAWRSPEPPVLPVIGRVESGSLAYPWSKSDLEIPRSLLIWWSVPVARSRLLCLGMIARRPLAEFSHISRARPLGAGICNPGFPALRAGPCRSRGYC